jgi:hypothetical protein
LRPFTVQWVPLKNENEGEYGRRRKDYTRGACDDVEGALTLVKVVAVFIIVDVILSFKVLELGGNHRILVSLLNRRESIGHCATRGKRYSRMLSV